MTIDDSRRQGAAAIQDRNRQSEIVNRQSAEHLDRIALAVQQLLAGQAHGRLRRRVAEWPALLEDADDLCQLAALAFVEAYRAGRIAPDAETQAHTARSVAAYAWGIVSRIFANAVRRSRPASWQYVESEHDEAGNAYNTAPLIADRSTGGGAGATDARATTAFEALLPGGPGDEDSRLWDVLRSAEGRCAEKDIIVTYLLASGASSAEVSAVLGLSENVPRNALKRVGKGIREILEMEETA